MKGAYKDLYNAQRLAGLKDQAELYAGLPLNFRETLAKAARIKEDRRGLRLDELTPEERHALLDACKRLKANVEKAWPVLIRSNPTRLPL